MKEFIHINNIDTYLNRYRGKRLIVKGYGNSPNTDYFVCDLLQPNILIGALYEIESGESDLSIFGSSFLSKLKEDSDVSRYLSDINDANVFNNVVDLYTDYKPEECKQRISSVGTKTEIFAEMAEYYGIPVESLLVGQE